MPDLPEISQDMDQPLPQVDPNSQLVPYHMSRTDPGQAPVITTGYGPRARPPIQPPDSFGGGVGMPNLDQIYQAAFSKLPVEEAAKAVEAATRYVGLRGYQRDIQNGMAADQAFTKWGPALFKQATGIPEAFQLKMQQAKMNAPVIRGSGAVSGLYRIPKTGPAETLVEPRQAAPKLHFNNTTGEVLQELPDGTIKTVKEGTPRTDAEEKEYERQLRSAQSALDIAKRNFDKFSTTKPVTTGGLIFPKKTVQQPMFPGKADPAKAALEAAQNALDEKKDLLDKYRAQKKKGIQATKITHRYDLKTGKFEEVTPTQESE